MLPVGWQSYHRRMTWLVVLLVFAVLLASSVPVRRMLASRRAAELEASGNFRLSRRAADEDVTRLGEELSELHFETLTDELDADMRADYQRALDAYEEAKARVRAAERAEDVTAVTHTLEDGRFAMACVLARRDGADLPDRRPPCFFNPAHGPARTDVTWAPTGGVEREIPVCFPCRERLAEGVTPDVRRVRFGNRTVPWFQGGPAYGAYAEGYYGRYARDGHFPEFIVAAMLLGGAPGGTAAVGWGSSGAWSGWEGGGLWVDDGPGSTSYDWGGGPGDGGFGIGDGGGDGGGGGDAGG